MNTIYAKLSVTLSFNSILGISGSNKSHSAQSDAFSPESWTYHKKKIQQAKTTWLKWIQKSRKIIEDFGKEVCSRD